MAETITWIAPDGTSTVLTAQTNTEVLWGRLGAFMPPVTFVEHEIPLQSGSQLHEIRYRPRRLDLPFLIRGTSATALRANVRSFLHVFDPSRGDGTLRIQGPGGDERELTCRYMDGLIGHETDNLAGPSYQRVMITFRAFDPFWYAKNAIVNTYTVGVAATFFPFFPLRLTNSVIFADVTVNNTGDVNSWPTWVITGPGSTITLRNLTSGENLVLSTTLLAGETVTIDTRPGFKSVSKNDGTNLFSSLSTTSVLWDLRAGNNSIRLEMGGSTSASAVQLTYKPRFLSL